MDILDKESIQKELADLEKDIYVRFKETQTLQDDYEKMKKEYVKLKEVSNGNNNKNT